MRRGLGVGTGKGYKNLAPMDSHIHSLSAKGVKLNAKFDITEFIYQDGKNVWLLNAKLSPHTKKNFNINKKNILDSTEKYSNEPVFNFMYNARTGELLLGGRTAHSDLLRSRDMQTGKKSNFNEWVRGKYDKKGNRLFVRHYFNPQSHYAEFTSADFDISEKMQKRMVDVLRKEGLPKDVKVIYNQSNESLKQEGFVHV